ncbi:MAG: hypothetical protein HOQ05_05840 [Corynebacteriales bacterium]|nr:hypothetical protein [Mycobacteriales bacterium]
MYTSTSEPGRHRRNSVAARISHQLSSIWARLALVACLGMFSLLGLQNYDASAETGETAPTVRFNGAVNVLGILNGVNVSPSQVQIPAGGEVIIANDAGTPLTVTVGSQDFSLSSGQSRAVEFSGGAVKQSVPVRATALNLPVLGSITSSTSTVNVAAKQNAPSESSKGPNDSAHTPEPDKSEPNKNNNKPDDQDADEPQDGENTTTENTPSPTPTQEADVTDAGGISALSSNSRAASDERAISTLGDERASTSPNAMSGNSGLLVAVVIVVMVGIGSAGLRVLVGYRALHRFR